MVDVAKSARGAPSGFMCLPPVAGAFLPRGTLGACPKGQGCPCHFCPPRCHPRHSSLVIRHFPRLFPGHLPLRSRDRTGTMDCLGELAWSTLKLPS